MSKAKLSDVAETIGEINAEALAERDAQPEVIKPKTRGKARVVNLIDDEGNVISRATHARLLEGLLDAAGIEAAVRDGTRPKVVSCLECKSPRKVSRAGFIPIKCRECVREDRRVAACEAARKRRAVNPEADREAKRKWYADNREARQEIKRKWLEANREKVREYDHKRYAENPEKAREAARRWREANPEKVREAYRKQNAKNGRERARAYRARKKAEREAAKKAEGK